MEVMMSFFSEDTWNTPLRLTQDNQFDGMPVAASVSPSNNPVPHLFVCWLHANESMQRCIVSDVVLYLMLVVLTSFF